MMLSSSSSESRNRSLPEFSLCSSGSLKERRNLAACAAHNYEACQSGLILITKMNLKCSYVHVFSLHLMQPFILG